MQKPEYYDKLIRNVPDFPKKGIQFKDITTLIKDAKGLDNAVSDLAASFKDAKVDKVLGIESRGFVFGTGIALKLGKGFILARKPGKLPAKTERAEYSLEYGKDAIEVHVDAINKGERVLIIDDLLATGGTFVAAAKLVEKLGGIVAGIGCVIELTGSLHGRDQLKAYKVVSLVQIPVHE
ncbi:MAG: adenine phosphoribosyltransferase [Candidatus Lokiarchaeota archaeon]|nr:adenine phosphoribosyltransferase [Candidatus Lokiarchaeota archaeon]